MDNQDLYKQLYTLLEQNVFFGDRLGSRQFVSLLTPGQFVSTSLRKGNPDDEYNIYDLCNKTIDSTFLWQPLTSEISKLYGEIVEFAALPEKPIDEALVKKLTKKLKGLTPLYDKYFQAYEDVDILYVKALNEDPQDPIKIIELKKKRDLARRELDDPNRGNRKEYNNTLGELNAQLSGNPRSYWETEVREPYINARTPSTRADYWPTFLDVHPSDWDKAGWSNNTIHVSSTYNRDYSKSTSFSAGASGRWGLWSAGGSYSKSTLQTDSQSRITDITINFELLRINIQRPWMNNNILGRRFWAWKKSVSNLLISDGGNLPNQRPLGPRGMPVLPTTFFIARKVKLKGNWSQEDRTYFEEQIKAKASFGWGPFSASGSYSETTTERTYTGNFQDAELTIEQPQIIAVGGTLIPRSPDPDPALSWSHKPGEEPWLDTPNALEDLELIRQLHNSEKTELRRVRLREEYLKKVGVEFDARDIHSLEELD